MDVYYTLHAQRTMADRGVTREEVERVLARPAVTYRNNAERPDCSVYQTDDLAVVAAPQYGGLIVITVLWRRINTWTTEEMRNGR